MSSRPTPAGEVPAIDDAGMVEVMPTATTTYTLTATGKNTVPASESVTVTVTAMPTATSILSFTAEPAEITSGQTTTFHVTAANATGASIDQSVGDVPLRPDGSGKLHWIEGDAARNCCNDDLHAHGKRA